MQISQKIIAAENKYREIKLGAMIKAYSKKLQYQVNFVLGCLLGYKAIKQEGELNTIKHNDVEQKLNEIKRQGKDIEKNIVQNKNLLSVNQREYEKLTAEIAIIDEQLKDPSKEAVLERLQLQRDQLLCNRHESKKMIQCLDEDFARLTKEHEIIRAMVLQYEKTIEKCLTKQDELNRQLEALNELFDNAICLLDTINIMLTCLTQEKKLQSSSVDFSNGVRSSLPQSSSTLGTPFSGVTEYFLSLFSRRPASSIIGTELSLPDDLLNQFSSSSQNSSSSGPRPGRTA